MYKQEIHAIFNTKISQLNANKRTLPGQLRTHIDHITELAEVAPTELAKVAPTELAEVARTELAEV